MRIAPVERWCEVAKAIAAKHPVVLQESGKYIDIFTESARQGVTWQCGGREWQVEPKLALERRTAMNFDSDFSRWWVCEHVLEMD